MDFLTHLRMRVQKLGAEICQLEKYLSDSTEGSLIIRKKKDNFNYSKKIIVDGAKKEIYLPKGSKDANALALKEYSKRRIKEAKAELFYCNQLLTSLSSPTRTERYLSSHAGIANLVEPILNPVKESNLEYLNGDYPRNPYNPEGLKYPTVLQGLKVRSKSEADIISQLVYCNIPFRYEEGIQTPSGMLYPDISCLNLSTNKKIYWEHAGLMDNIKYATSFLNKLSRYYDAGLILWDNLIITTETSNNPLDINFVYYIIINILC